LSVGIKSFFGNQWGWWIWCSEFVFVGILCELTVNVFIDKVLQG